MDGDGGRTGGAAALGARREERGIRVLHVDDDPAFADLTAARLERTAGDGPAIRVETATDPADAPSRLSGVDCVVSDFEMPETDGLELLAAVRDRRPGLPFVLFTGKGSEEIASRAVSAGVTDYLRKGGTADRFDVLANRIRNAVARYRAERAVERSETRLRRVVDLLPQCIFVKDERGRYVLMNRAGARSHGLTVDAVEGRLEADLLPEEDAERFRAEDREILATGEPKVVPEQRRRAEDGSLVVERVRKVPFELEATGEDGVLGVADDITASYFRERRREATLDELAAAEAALADARADDGDDESDAHDRVASRLARAQTLLSEGGPFDDGTSDASADGDTAVSTGDGDTDTSTCGDR